MQYPSNSFKPQLILWLDAKNRYNRPHDMRYVGLSFDESASKTSPGLPSTQLGKILQGTQTGLLILDQKLCRY